MKILTCHVPTSENLSKYIKKTIRYNLCEDIAQNIAITNYKDVENFRFIMKERIGNETSS